ncbi:MAG: START domain-containing protein [Bacteroidota bacterium]
MKTNLLGALSWHCCTGFILFALIAGLFPNSLFAQNEGGWELKRDKGDIVVYVRESKDSDIKELKFETELEASLNSIAAILMDVEGFDDWVYSSVVSRTVKQISDTEVIYYNEIDFPWPLSNRDLVLHSRFWQDKETKAIHSQTFSAHDLLPEEKGLVRMTKADIHWIFTPIGNGKVNLVYTLSTDPGGSIPAWMINLAADQGPLLTMVKFKEEIEKEKYRNAKLAFVQEFD